MSCKNVLKIVQGIFLQLSFLNKTVLLVSGVPPEAEHLKPLYLKEKIDKLNRYFANYLQDATTVKNNPGSDKTGMLLKGWRGWVGHTQWARVIHYESPSEHWVTVC